MPCWEVETTKVSLEASDRELLKRAIESLVESRQIERHQERDGVLSGYHYKTGLSFDLNLNTGSLEASGGQAIRFAPQLRNAVEKAYAKVVLEAAASEFGLDLQPTENVDEYRLSI